ncbi:hypothetical protein AAEO56_05395 [Flavobacterium sp. DGU11]|uniref:Lipocalin-like domain-containing protein n=1 Tax=Flavobacterium arundinis TaxID=3139143 RepID=A0ABU9HUP9_9FLAO
MKTLLSILILCTLFLSVSFPEQEKDDITGVYISKQPTFGEKAAMMYLRGHPNFLYTGPKNEKLELKPDSTFVCTINTCSEGLVSYTGTWKRSGKTVTLHPDNADYKDSSLTIYKKNRLYTVSKVKISDSGETMPHLTLLEKQ